MELVDMYGLGPYAERLESSSLSLGTTYFIQMTWQKGLYGVNMGASLCKKPL